MAKKNTEKKPRVRKPKKSAETVVPEVTTTEEAKVELALPTVEALPAPTPDADPNTPVCDTFAHYKEGADPCVECATAFPIRNAACIAALNAAKPKKSGRKSTVVTRVGKYSNLAELTAAIAALNSPTSAIDKMALEGKFSLSGMLSEANSLRAEKFKDWADMKTVSKIKNHLEYRCTRGWVIKIGLDGIVKVVDFNGKSNKLAVEAEKPIEELPAAETVTEEAKAA